jgi:hypothetical protein
MTGNSVLTLTISHVWVLHRDTEVYVIILGFFFHWYGGNIHLRNTGNKPTKIYGVTGQTATISLLTAVRILHVSRHSFMLGYFAANARQLLQRVCEAGQSDYTLQAFGITSILIRYSVHTWHQTSLSFSEMTVFRDVTPSNVVHRRFGGTYSPHLQHRR